jgi:hypothetical protein
MSGTPWRLIGTSVILILLMGLGFAAYQHGRTTADVEWQARRAEKGEFQAKARAAAESSARAEEQRWQTAINQVGNDARQQQAIVTTDAAVADAAGERVREQAGILAANAGCSTSDTGTAERDQAATRAAMVLSDLFQRADKRAGELAKAYDATRIAGLACDASYRALSRN